MRTNKGPAVVVVKGLESFWAFGKDKWCSVQTDNGLYAVVSCSCNGRPRKLPGLLEGQVAQCANR